ncbi:YeeE/YedE family protein [Ectothiorhodospiraceae bacterium WFHF3C12]|nr:YeeE/YedE family protein [Ectothiorhodospiraceae bacterium WFHF3C12]
MASTTPNAAYGAESPTVDTPRVDRFIVGLTLAFAVILGGLIYLEAPTDRVWLFLIGGGLGISLYHAAFGFTAGWRRFVVHRRSGGLRAQLVLLGIATVLFVPVLGNLEALGVEASGAVAPVGLSLVVGSFMFGFGMQLGGGCGSGTLFTVGAGNRRMLITLAFFIVGSVLGTFHLPWWLDQPGFDPVSLLAHLGVGGAVAVQLLALGALAWWLMRLERRRHGGVDRVLLKGPDRSVGATLLTGGWPLMWGAVALALLNLATLLMAGYPWGITFAFALWGAKALGAVGVDLSQWEFWTWDYPSLALRDSVLVNVVSVMDFGLLLGAMLAAGLAGRFNRASRKPLDLGGVSSAVIGGLVMGYGARLAFGCNIGAMFSGIASASLHGWIWFACAFVGSALAIRLRPRFGLDNG